MTKDNAVRTGFQRELSVGVRKQAPRAGYHLSARITKVDE